VLLGNQTWMNRMRDNNVLKMAKSNKKVPRSLGAFTFQILCDISRSFLGKICSTLWLYNTLRASSRKHLHSTKFKIHLTRFIRDRKVEMFQKQDFKSCLLSKRLFKISPMDSTSLPATLDRDCQLGAMIREKCSSLDLCHRTQKTIWLRMVTIFLDREEISLQQHQIFPINLLHHQQVLKW